MNCQLSVPLIYDGTLPTTKQDIWNYSQMVCSTDYSDFVNTISAPPTSTYKFLLKREYTFGDITQILMLGLISLFVVFYILKRIFTHEEVKIHTIHAQKF